MPPPRTHTQTGGACWLRRWFPSLGCLLNYLLAAELACGLVALILTALAFIEVSWGEGGSQDSMKRASRQRAGKLFAWGGMFWVLTLTFFVLMR